tara:strand:- start:149 stop:712 length:564 start_codon:yes stop_codon:yes gene_type:complete
MDTDNQEKQKLSFTDFIKKNKIKVLSLIILFVLFLIVVIVYSEYTKKQNSEISREFNKAKILILNEKKEEAFKILDKIIFKKNKFYSTSSLNLIVENELVKDKGKILEYYDEIIKNTKLDKDTKDLLIFKKIIFIGDDIKENELLSNLRPLMQSNSVWKGTVSDYIKQYYLSKNEFKKATEFGKSLK